MHTHGTPTNGNTYCNNRNEGYNNWSSNKHHQLEQPAKAAEVANANGVTSEIWYALNVSGATTGVTINLASSLKASAVITEYSNIANVGALDKTSSTTGNSASPSTGTTATTAYTDELWVGALDAIGSATYSTPTNSFAIVASSASTGGPAGSRERSAFLERIVLATGAATTGATLSATAQWAGAIATFAAPLAPTVTTPTVTAITGTGATLGANVTSLGIPATISARGTCWGTSAAPVTNCLAEGGTTTGVFTQARTGMTAGTFYYYRGYATNSTGTGYSADGTFTTASASATLSASPTTCTILSGGSTCTVPFTWSISNAISPNLYNATTLSTYSTSASGTNLSYAITNGSNTVQARDSSTVLATVSVSASCTSGTTWSGGIYTSTTISRLTAPTSATVAPESGTTDLDYFTLETSTGADTVTAMTVSLLPAGANNNISQVDLTDGSNVAKCPSILNPSSNAISFLSCSISVSTTAATYKVRITPKTHALMPAPSVGQSYGATGMVTDFTSTNARTLSDTTSATITIDNLSPTGTTGASASGGDSAATVSWTNPGDADFSNLVVLRDTATIGIGSTPGEGTSPIVGSSCGGTACQVRYILGGTSFTDTGLTNGTLYYYRIFAKDTHGNYTAYASTEEKSVTPTPTSTTNLGTGTDPSATTIAPGAGASDVDYFTLQTNGGTEAVSSVTVNLSTNSGVGRLAVTDNANAELGFTNTPSAGLNTIAVAGLTAGVSLTTYKIRVTPFSHTAMPSSGGDEYAITATHCMDCSYTHGNRYLNALTIDNLSGMYLLHP